MSAPRLALALALTAPLATSVARAQPVTKDRPVSTPMNRGAAKTVWPDEGPATWAARPTVPEITANDLRSRLYPLADDSMQGRRIGELGNFKGTEYIAREFQRLGLKPGGDNGTYFQVMPFGPARFDSASARLTVGGQPLAAKTDWIPSAPSGANGFGGKAELTNVATVFVGEWGATTAIDPATVRGKVAVFLAAQPSGGAGGAGAGRGGRGGAPAQQRCDSLPDRFGAAAAGAVEAAQREAAARAAASRGQRPPTAAAATARDVRAQTAGAAAVLVIGLDSLPRNAVSGAFDSRMGMQPTAGSNVPGAIISRAAAERMFGTTLEQLAPGAAGQPVSAAWSYDWRMSPTPARNVVAILPGSDPARAGEYVLVSAHNDHVGTNPVAVDHDSLRAVMTVTRMQGANDTACRPSPDQQRRIDSLIARARSIRPPRRDSINNGADDDGSGTVVMLEIAEKFASEKPARSIVFVSHNGEEGGLLGSAWFTSHPTIDLDKVVAAHNMDMVSKGRVEQVKFGGPNSLQMLGARRLSREFGDVIDSVNATRAEPMALDKSWEVPSNPLNRFCRSDQVNYVSHDVPVTYFSLGYAQDYHQVTDEPRYAQYDHAAKVGRFIHDVMWAISERKARLSEGVADTTMPRCGR